MGVTVHDVAAALIEAQHNEGRTIDKMQLQKLLFLVQGAHLRLAGTPAFRAEFLAYKHGPVIEQVESTYRHLSNDGTIDRPLGGRPERVDAELAETIATVIRVYGTWTGPNLERRTKQPRSPWRIARRGIPDGDKSREPIPLSDIARWFLTHPLDDPNPPEQDADPKVAGRERAADGDIAAGRVESFDDVESFIASLR